MKKAIIGKKVGMTQIFDETGKVIPVTVIEAGPCVVVAKMTKEKEGYDAVQFGYEEVAEKKLTKPEKGHLQKAGVGMVKHHARKSGHRLQHRLHRDGPRHCRGQRRAF